MAECNIKDEKSKTVYQFNKGLAFIFSNVEFSNDSGNTETIGTLQDGRNLEKCLQSIKFEVILSENLTAAQIRETLKTAKDTYNYDDFDALFIAVISHGCKDYVYGSDMIELKETSLLKPFKKLEALIGKPKIVLIESCQGHKRDRGVVYNPKNEEMARNTSVKLPISADVLRIYPTFDGYISVAKDSGSPYLLAFMRKIRDAKDEDFLSILTQVNQDVAFNFVSSESPSLRGVKQAPTFSSSLTKKLYFK